MKRIRMSSKRGGMYKERYNELTYFCLQYAQYRRERTKYAARRIQLIEQALICVDPGVTEHVKRNVTEGTRWEEMPVPMGRNQFYAERRKFFMELNRLLRKVGDQAQ